ncbi:hypothetical protein HD806DRAFT_520320 [Xylariaceae sp. AK1471]|nr:hypothetical protein HD806DRAFT_520320 [Xylariaceae sp. AK1471]
MSFVRPALIVTVLDALTGKETRSLQSLACSLYPKPFVNCSLSAKNIFMLPNRLYARDFFYSLILYAAVAPEPAASVFAKRLPYDTAPEKYSRCTIEWREPDETLGETFLGRRLRLIGPRGTRHGLLTEVAEIRLMDHLTALEYRDYSLDGRVVEVSAFTFMTHGKIKIRLTELPAADKTAKPAIKVELEE